MTDIADTIDTYLQACSETDPTRRHRLIAAAWNVDGRLVDPPMDAAGHDAIHALAGQVHSQFPGATFRRTTQIDSHHGFARYGWELATDDEVALTGIDVVHVDDDGKLTIVVGFFGDIPNA